MWPSVRTTAILMARSAAFACALASSSTMAAPPEPRGAGALTADASSAGPGTPGAASDEGSGGRCAPDVESASRAVTLAFGDLVDIHQRRIPGPSGQRVLDDKVDALLDRVVDLDRFSATALAPVWSALDPAQQRAWQDNLLIGLRGHYLRRLTDDASPVGQHLDVARAEVACDRATVELTLARREGRDHTDVALRMLWTGARWRAFDVSVDGVSLLETWKSRVRQIYRDGGLTAVDAHLRDLAERNRGR